jgi:SAM-dependent methyltransferase
MTELRKQCIAHIEHLVSILPPVKKVLDVGLAGDVKPSGNFYLFSGTEFKTLDIDAQYGPDYVDDIMAPENAPEGYFDLVILSNTLEHTPDPVAAVVGARKLLKDGGYLLVDCPFQYPYHAEDGFLDFWRMTKDGMEHVLKRSEMRIVKVMPGNLITSALAQK